MARGDELWQTAAHDPFGRPALFVPRRVTEAANAVAVVGGAALALASLAPSLLAYFAIGLGLGIATCIPIGIANVIVIDATYRHGVRRAIGAAIGGALADGMYASLGIFGIGPLIEQYPFVPRLLHAVSACVLLVYGLVLLRSRPLLVDAGPPVSSPSRGELGTGFAIGLGATLLNPSAVVTWVVIVGAHATGVARQEAGAWVAGIVVGTFAWFMVVMTLALRGRRVLRDKAVWMTRVIALVVIGSGVYSLSRVVALGMVG